MLVIFRSIKFWLITIVVFACFAMYLSCRSDLAANYDICFKEDFPGANNRYVEFTPVRCSHKETVLGEPIGGEFARLYYEDIDSDGISEVVVSSEFWCNWGFEPCYNPTLTVVKVQPEKKPVFIIIKETKLIESRRYWKE